MGNARARGSLEDRQRQARARGGDPHRDVVLPRDGAPASSLAALFEHRLKRLPAVNGLPERTVVERRRRDSGSITDARGREYVFDGESIRRAR
jgi:hypothetical protein